MGAQTPHSARMHRNAIQYRSTTGENSLFARERQFNKQITSDFTIQKREWKERSIRCANRMITRTHGTKNEDGTTARYNSAMLLTNVGKGCAALPPHTPREAAAAMTPFRMAPDRTAGFELMQHAASGEVGRLRRRLEGASPEERSALVDFADYDSRRPLHIACCEGHVAVVKELLKMGADWSCKDRYGATCVDDAVQNGRLEVLRVLGDFGAAFPSHSNIEATDVNPGYALGRDLSEMAATGNIRAAKQLVKNFDANGKLQP